MKYEWLEEYLTGLPGVEKDYKLEWQWDRYMIRGKLFAAVCSPEGMKNEAYNGHTLINLKCEPRLAELYRAEYPEVLPGFYCDKKNWNAVLLDGDLDGELLRETCRQSYELVLRKLPKYVQKEISENQG